MCIYMLDTFSFNDSSTDCVTGTVLDPGNAAPYRGYIAGEQALEQIIAKVQEWSVMKEPSGNRILRIVTGKLILVVARQKNFP